jgi:hypothetical protein
VTYRCLTCQINISDVGEAIKHSTDGCKVVPKHDTDMGTHDSRMQGDY